MDYVIEVKNLGKKYNIKHHSGGYVTLREIITNALKNPLRFLKKKTKEIIGIDTKEEFWALREFNFNVEKGEVIGIIGPNGAGKSTLLKILTGITPPTEGEVRIKGKVASLLEVGTGFHPELTGRENIFLNGAILGMTRKEISQKFNQIVEFSGIEKFIDTPVKHYSSGMHVRLAFSVAAHMEPDILLIDEVLAVGDAEFQEKCLGKMEEVTKGAGRTILFVSHNMGVIQNLCTKTILIEKGKITAMGETGEVVHQYLYKNQGSIAVSEYKIDISKEVQISKISVIGKTDIPQSRIPISDSFFIKVEFEVFRPVKNTSISVLFYSQGERLLFSSDFDKTLKLKDYEPGKYVSTLHVPSYLFNVGDFYFDVFIGEPSIVGYDSKRNIPLEILNTNNPRSPILRGVSVGKIAIILNFDIERLV